MPTYEFTIRLHAPFADDDYDRLFEAGFDDATPGNEDGRGFVLLSREAPSFPNALASAVVGLRQAGFEPIGILTDDAISLRTVAARLNRSYEGVRLLAKGHRGPGGFPAPISTEGWALFSWAAVSKWATEVLGEPVAADEEARFAAAANHVLQAHELVPDERAWKSVKELI